jgi:aquaporin Z
VLERDYLRRGAAELIGTFALIFIGAGAAYFGRLEVDYALANGLVIAVMVSAFGFISGGHFNPAVTLGFLVTRRIAPALAVWYWIVQLGGAALAALMLRWVLPATVSSSGKLGVPGLANGMTAGGGVVIEAVLTFFLVIVVFATAVDERGAFKQIAGLAIGLTIAFGVMMGSPYTGGAINPARAFGPQLVGDHWDHWWVWYLGPFAGAVIAACIYELLYLRPATVVPVGPEETGVRAHAPGKAAAS